MAETLAELCTNCRINVWTHCMAEKQLCKYCFLKLYDQSTVIIVLNRNQPTSDSSTNSSDEVRYLRVEKARTSCKSEQNITVDSRSFRSSFH